MCERERREKEGRSEDGWTVVRRRTKESRKDDWSNKHETTFYIENLPDEITNNLLWKAFKSVGKLSDAYVAKKKDSAGNKFGFLRFLHVKDFEDILRKANEVRILGAVIKVSLARFDRNHRKIVHQPTFIPKQRPTWVPKNLSGNMHNVWESNKYYHGGKSFSDIVKNSAPNNPQRKNITIQGEGGLLQSHWVGKSLIGEAKNIQTLQGLRHILINKGFQDIGCSYLGGLKVLLNFHDRKQAIDFMKDHKEVWNLACESVKVWNGELEAVERIATLNIRGVPITLKDDGTFNAIGEKFGKILEGSKFSWGNLDVEVGSCTVLVNRWEKVDEVVNVIWKDKVIEVKVSEDGEPWRPKFDNSSCNSLEDGEIREDLPENSARSGEVREERRSEGEKPHLENHVHGNHNTFNAEFGSPRSLENEKVLGSFSVGLDPVQKSRKRRRRASSPLDSSSPQNLKTNPPTSSSETGPGPSRTDTTPPDFIFGAGMSVPPIPPPHMQNGAPIEVEESPPAHSDSATPMDEEPGAQVDPVRSSDDEVSETVKIGGAIGINLENCEEQVRKIVDEDGVGKCHQ